MKIRHCTICLSLILIAFLFSGCAGSTADNNLDTTKPSHPATASSSLADTQTLTEDDACNIALAHAGFSADQVTLLHAEYDWDHGIPHYDIEFYKDKVEYDYDVHAETGEILAFEKDWDD